MNRNDWRPVTIPANSPDPRGAVLDFILSDKEREDASRIQSQLEAFRNQPKKRRAA